MKKTFLLLLVAFSLSASAQQEHYFGFYLNGLTPQSNLKDSGYRNGGGFSFEYLSPSLFQNYDRVMEVRLGAGMEFLFNGGSNKVKDLVFNTPNNDLGWSKFQNNMFGFYVAPKFIFNTGKVKPYFDMMGAVRLFNTYQVNEFNREVSGYERRSTKPVIENAVLHYGGSLGLLYELNKNVMFDMRFSYTTGSTIKYADLSSVRKDPAMQSNVIYNTRTSPVSDVFVFRLGVLFTIDCESSCSNSYERKRHSEKNKSYTLPGWSPPSPKPADVKPIPLPQH